MTPAIDASRTFSETMRILFVCKCSPWKEGGAETRTKEVALRLARMGHVVTILCAKTERQDPHIEVLDGVRVICKKVLPDRMLNRFSYPSYVVLAASSMLLMFHLFFLLKKETFDLIREDMSPFPPSGLLSLVRLPTKTRIAVMHNLPGVLREWIKFYGPLYGIAGFSMDRFLRRGILKYDRIICAAKWLSDELKQHPEISSKIAYVPNGVRLDHFNVDKTVRASPEAIRLLSDMASCSRSLAG